MSCSEALGFSNARCPGTRFLCDQITWKRSVIDVKLSVHVRGRIWNPVTYIQRRSKASFDALALPALAAYARGLWTGLRAVLTGLRVRLRALLTRTPLDPTLSYMFAFRRAYAELEWTVAVVSRATLYDLKAHALLALAALACALARNGAPAGAQVASAAAAAVFLHSVVALTGAPRVARMSEEERERERAEMVSPRVSVD